MDENSTHVPDTGSTPESAGAVVAPPAEPPTSPVPSEPAPNGPRRGVFVAAVIVALVALVALAAAGWMYYEVTTVQRAAVERLDQATALVESADEVVLDVDDIVRAEIDSEMTTRVVDVAERVPGAVEELEEAVGLIAESIEDLPDDEVAYARALESSARARLDMLDEAEVILEANRRAAAALGPATKAWELVLESNTLSRQAVEEYNKLTRESVTRSSELTKESEQAIREAQALFSEAATAFPEVDFSDYLEYAEAKIAALEISKQADAAFLDDRPADANRLGEQYNDAEKELAEKAAALPASPAERIAAAYEELAGEATERYFQARARATEADARLRDATTDDPGAGDADVETDED